MKVFRKRFFKLTIFLMLVICFLISVTNRVKWGVWSPFNDPARIDVNGRRYYANSTIQHISSNIKLKNIKGLHYWGRSLYVSNDAFENYHYQHSDYMECFLKESNTKYRAYTLSGSQ